MDEKRFGQWTVEDASSGKWLCVCDCGTRRRVPRFDVRSGKSKGCGCSRMGRMAKAQRAAVTKHGRSDDPIHRIWIDMRRRCSQPGRPDYPRYGGRGIRVCDRWLGDGGFANFFADMGERPSPGHSLDRVDPNGPYSPENCRWVTRREQARNTRTNVYVDVDGSRVPLADAAERYGIHYPTLLTRYRTLKWDIMKALTTPIRGRK